MVSAIQDCSKRGKSGRCPVAGEGESWQVPIQLEGLGVVCPVQGVRRSLQAFPRVARYAMIVPGCLSLRVWCRHGAHDRLQSVGPSAAIAPKGITRTEQFPKGERNSHGATLRLRGDWQRANSWHEGARNPAALRQDLVKTEVWLPFLAAGAVGHRVGARICQQDGPSFWSSGFRRDGVRVRRKPCTVAAL